ncbi:MAG: type II toxin-antitoxin system VapC family toxin [Pseudolysinimonas sp.]
MTQRRAVVDASALIKLLVDAGAGGEVVARRLRGAELAAPDHVAVEVMSALRRLKLARLIGETEARLALDAFWALPIQRWPLEAQAERTWQLGSTLSTYDGAYVALAERLGAPLLTADARLARASGPTCVIEVFA